MVKLEEILDTNRDANAKLPPTSDIHSQCISSIPDCPTNIRQLQHYVEVYLNIHRCKLIVLL